MSKIIYVLFLTLCISNNGFAQEYERYKKLVDTTITSKHLGFDKNITVTVPFEWQDGVNQEFPLIIVFDKQNKRSHQYILNTIDYLTSNEQMPSSVIISVQSEQKYRYLETSHLASNPNGLALENEKFIFNELIPLAENEYNASSFRLLIGHSRYGYFTSALFHSKINELNAVISLSPFFTQKNVNLIDSIGQMNGQNLKSNKYYRFGIGNDYPTDYVKMDLAIKQFNNISIDAKGFLFKEADHNVTPGLTIGTALYEIFEEWSKIQSKYISDAQKDLSIYQALGAEITANYGNSIPLSLGILNGKGWSLYNENQFDSAIEAWEILLKFYPNFSEAYLYIMDAQQQSKQDTTQTVSQFKYSLSTSTIYSETEKAELRLELENMSK